MRRKSFNGGVLQDKIMTGTRDCALRGGYKICLIVGEKQS